MYLFILERENYFGLIFMIYKRWIKLDFYFVSVVFEGCNIRNLL